jgi:DNA-binding SARP family transcriptional activator
MRVYVLGPVRVEVAGTPVRLGPRLRTVLAVLALARGRSVSRARLVELAWGDPAPAAAETTLRSHVLHLRRLLEPDRPARSASTLLVTDGAGYALRLGPGQLDAAEFEALVERGRRALAAGEPAAALAELDRALALWRGPALGELAGTSFGLAEAARLEELRRSARHGRLDAELALGGHQRVVAELTALVAEEPYQEDHRLRLVLALYRSHRPDQAAEVCRRGLELAGGRGVDSPALRDLQEAILRNDPALDRPGDAPVQLPPDVADFTGRAAELADLTALLGGPAPVAVSGRPGVGKSALAVHAAHRLAGRFPGGVLYVDLRGGDPDGGRAPYPVLDGFLRALGVPAAEVPADLDTAAAAYRSRLTGRRVLVVLDNAAGAAQVRPLLPAGPRCAVLVTSRVPLADLDGATPLSLDLLTGPDALALLARLVGERRVRAEPTAAADLVRLCGGLPLALRIAGSRLRARPRWPLSALVARLADERGRLSELAVGDRAVRSSFADSYRALPAAQALLYRSLALLPGPDAGAEVVAAATGLPPERAADGLERLVDAHLVESPAPGRYRLHDLLRLFARERGAAEDDPGWRRAALAAALEWYAVVAARAAEQVRERDTPAPPDDRFPDAAAARLWLDTERANLVAAVLVAADGDGDTAARIGAATAAYLNVGKHWPQWRAVGEAALRAALRHGRPGAQAQAHYWLGTLLCQQRRLDAAAEHLERAVALHAAHPEQADPVTATVALGDLGVVHAMRGRTEEAVEHLERALAASRDCGARHVRAKVLNNLALAHDLGGRPDAAERCLREAIAICHDIGRERQEGICWDSLGGIHSARGRHLEAIECYGVSLAIFERLADRYSTAMTLRGLGTATAAVLGPAAARPHWRRALATFEAMRAPEADDVRALLAGTEVAGRDGTRPGSLRG